MKWRGVVDKAVLHPELAAWPGNLMVRSAGPRLRGVKVYSDHNATLQFKYGKELAWDLIDSCPEGFTPALLLSNRDANLGTIIIAGGERVAVVNSKRFVDYGCHRFSDYQVKETGVRSEFLSEVAHMGANVTANVLDDYAKGNLSRVNSTIANVAPEGDPTPLLTGLRSWASGDELAREAILSVADELTVSRFSPSDLVRCLREMDSWGEEMRQALASFLSEEESRPDRLALLRAVMGSVQGVEEGGQVFGESTQYRLESIEAKAHIYNNKILREEETEMQRYLTQNPWIISMDYARLTPKRNVARGAMDFYGERYDGEYDIIELKSPQAKLVLGSEGPPGAPSDYRLGPDVALALGQAFTYQQQTEEGATFLNLKPSKRSRIIVILGLKSSMDKYTIEILRRLNQSLNGVKVLAYDELGNLALHRVKNIRACLSLIEPQEAEELQ